MTGGVQVRDGADLADAAATARGGARKTDGTEEAAGLSGETAEWLRLAGVDVGAVARVVRAALDEDFRYGPDVTSAATVAGRRVTADVVAREAGVLAGVPVALVVLDLITEFLGGPDGGSAGACWWRTGRGSGLGKRCCG